MLSRSFINITNVFWFLITTLIVLLVFLFFSIDFRTQIIDLNSPDKTLKIVASIRDGGATTSYSTNLYVASFLHNQKREGNAFFKADKIKNLNVVWKTNEEIDLYFEDSRIFHYNNFIWVKDSKGKSRRIKINLIQVDFVSKCPKSLFLQYSKYERVLKL